MTNHREKLIEVMQELICPVLDSWESEHSDKHAKDVINALVQYMKDNGLVIVPREITEDMGEACDEPFHTEWQRQTVIAKRHYERIGEPMKMLCSSAPFTNKIYKAAIQAGEIDLGGE